ncbi:MAG: thrombospondin type 3 repeat-containing protein [Deltaproteobacteria bacterium]|nr:thrombospondin type 3 repeat-containing protein [Deltaproteobacteria bacterium]
MWIAGLAPGLSGCRGGEGSECLTDSDCEQGLICIKRTQKVEGKDYEEKWGTCFRDTDLDSIPDDGDLDGSPRNRRCGVHAIFHPTSGLETIYQEVIGDCDDNCRDVSNVKTLLVFVCLAKDPCCPLPEEERAEAEPWEWCSDRTEQTDTCTACSMGDGASPETCYLSSALLTARGHDLKADGCLLCRPQSVLHACETNADCLEMVAHGDLPEPACSGEWTCHAPGSKKVQELGLELEQYCRFDPFMDNKRSDSGYDVLYQLDSDWDGLGDSCDNCKHVPNGIDCDVFPERCDVDGDGTTSGAELASGDQANRDNDSFGDVCDLCPDLADKDNGDNDGDGRGNPCDSDDDNDGVCDPGAFSTPQDPCVGEDNCPLVANSGQENLDGDDKGDACDPDRDDDGIREDGDNSGVEGDKPCATDQSRECDDNCPDVPNEDQTDTDGDGLGDACDPD